MSDIPVNNVFPASIVRVLATNFTRVPGVDKIFKRRLRPIDPTRSVGVFSFDWLPGQMQIGQADPGTAVYNLRVECLIKHMSEEEGMTEHSVFSKQIRAMLYRDPQLRADLTMSDTSFGVIERLKDFRVLLQRFSSNDIGGTYNYLSYMDVSFNMEQVRIS